MKAIPARKTRPKPLTLTDRDQKILHAVYCHRFMTALDVCRLFFSPTSLTHVRSLLSALAGGEDGKTAQYLYRFQLPSTSTGNTEKVYTLGSKGRNFLEREMGLLVDWLFRPNKLKHFSYSQVLHSLLLTRFLVAAHAWTLKEPGFRLVKSRTCYELSR
jgi:hypothetical protein